MNKKFIFGCIALMIMSLLLVSCEIMDTSPKKKTVKKETSGYGGGDTGGYGDDGGDTGGYGGGGDTGGYGEEAPAETGGYGEEAPAETGGYGEEAPAETGGYGE